MNKKIVISTIAFLVIGGTVAFGSAQSNGDDDRETISNNQLVNLIEEEQAIEIAEKAVNGKVYSIELDEDDNRYEYELELTTAHGKVEIEMDASTGNIIEKDYDDLDDDWEDD